MDRISASEVLSILQNSTSDNFTNNLVKAEINLGDAVVIGKQTGLYNFLKFCRESSALQMDMLLQITAVDWLDEREERFDLVYHLLSLQTGARLRVKCPLKEDNLTVESVLPIWKSANFMEREVWDMFGISFNQHPFLKRILLYEGFKGHPLRKDYPLTGKQPRIPLRNPELQNTSPFMKRSELVSIRTNKKAV
jgi:NADH-quinone oxidoreductase subunit C